MTKRTFKNTVESIRADFFPRWDRKHQWCIKEVDSLPSFGICDQKNKTISIQPNLNDDFLEKLLIHEICHAVIHVHGGHGGKWNNRMLKASKVAKRIGQVKLSILLENEVKTYIKTEMLEPNGFPPKELIYEEIEDAVYYKKNISFNEVIKTVAKGYGFYPGELLSTFKECKSVYKRAKN